VTARLEIVIRRYGLESEPVLWQIVIRVAGALVGAGVADADGHAAVPATIASPVCRRWARSVLPDFDFGFAMARLDTVIRRHGFDAEPVSWQMVNLEGAATVRVVAPSPWAVTSAPASSTGAAAAIAMSRRFTSTSLVSLSRALGVFPGSGSFRARDRRFFSSFTGVSLQIPYTPTLLAWRYGQPIEIHA
jgi:hypothetical protein